MKQLVEGYDNSEISNHSDYRDFFLAVNTSDITESEFELRVAVQSYKLSMEIINSYMKKIAE
jgi:hypothetical protein